MPNMSNITVKAANGTSDVVFTALNPAGGDGSVARWSVNTANPVAALRPVFTASSRPNAKRDSRVVQLVGKYPDVRTLSGVDTVVGNVFFSGQVTIPEVVTDTVIAEAIAQFTNMLASSLIRDSMKSGFAPN